MAKQAKQDIVAAPSGELTEADIDRMALEQAGMGESDRAEDRIQSWVKVLQQLSPELNSRETAYVEGAKAGDIWIAAKSLLIPGQEGFLFQACGYQYAWVEWSGQPGSNSRIVNRYPDIPKQLGGERNWGRIDLPNGHQIVETRYHMGLVYGAGDLAPFPATITHSSTGNNAAINWIDQRRAKRNIDGSMFPIHRYLWRMVTVPKSNDRGHWYVLEAKGKAERKANPEQYMAGGEIATQIAEHQLKLGEDEGTSAQTETDSIPF